MPTRASRTCSSTAAGIAVGMATSIPPHNLREIIDGVLALIDDPSLPDDELLQAGARARLPDRRHICGRDGILSAYKTGRGIDRHARGAQSRRRKKDRRGRSSSPSCRTR
jgi:DNA gyrase subunit A